MIIRGLTRKISYKLKYGNQTKKSIMINNELDLRTIDLGEWFLSVSNEISLKELTFMLGGSGVLDYMFLKSLALKFNLKKYLEIGTYIGESINIMTDICEELISVTAEPRSEYSMMSYLKGCNLPDYSERLTYNEKITHVYGDSKKVNYEKYKDVDLFFIDGDHTYDGVYVDTRNIFENRKEDSIVVWHDFKVGRNEYNPVATRAVYDALGDDFQNVYVTDNNICAVYIPKKYRECFKLTRLKYETNRKLVTYSASYKIGIR